MAFLIIGVFIIGYTAIAFEHTLKINKSATALITGVLCWTIYIVNSSFKTQIADELILHLGEISQILFFLLGAMTIVELIDAHDGFEIITKRITTKSKRKLILIICLLSFFLSAILDNLTTAIVMVSLIRKIMADKNDRWLFAGAIIISANAGGTWSPIGDVTTTMLWIGGQITAGQIVLKLFFPGLVSAIIPLLIFQRLLKGEVQSPSELLEDQNTNNTNELNRNIVFFTGIGILLFVPLFKTITHLPPFMGILLGLGILWIIIEILHSNKNEQDRKYYTVSYALRQIDAPSVLFFLGILLGISALQSTGQLLLLAKTMDTRIGNPNIIILLIGLLSSIVDNVPLVAASMGMYPISQYPQNHFFWEFLAYCSGTGGSILIIGSAAGVAAMGMEKIDFIWYLKKISWIALTGYFAGAAVYLLQEQFF